MTKKQNMLYLTVLSIMSSFAVVLLHTNSIFWEFSTKRYWFTANIIEGIFYFAVPVFFMITGVTLLDYRDKYNTKVFFKKRLSKTFIPFIFWSFICLIFSDYISGQLGLQTFNLLHMFDSIVNVKANDFYWYFPALFGVYLCIPVLSLIPKDKKIEAFQYIVFLTIIFNYILPLVFKFLLNDIKYGNSYYFHMGSRYICYICTGYLLHNIDFSKKHKLYIYITGILSLFVTIVMTYKLSYEANDVIKTFMKYESLTQYFYAVMIFIFVKGLTIKIKNIKLINIIRYVGNYTFSIYLLHWFFTTYMTRVLGINRTIIGYRVGGAFVVYFGCIILIFILRKVPFMKRFLP